MSRQNPGGGRKTSRHTVLSLTFGSTLALGLSLVFRPEILIWNLTPSVPRGLYLRRFTHAPKTGELALCRLPPAARALAAERQYLPDKVPLIKPVAASAGAIICRSGNQVTINGKRSARALDKDRMGRLMPAWSGCHTLKTDEIFLMNAAVADSFDGRYFGPISTRLVMGQAIPAWTENPVAATLPATPVP